jgi:thioredoxin reductase
MKKIALTFVTLAALSTASFASQRGYDLRDTEYWTTSGKSDTSSASSTIANQPFAVIGGGEMAFERASRLSYENDHGRH